MRIKIELERIQWSTPFLENVYDCGHKIVDDNSADIFVKAVHLITKEDLECGKKFIALERKDGASIFKRTIFKHPSIIRYVKQYKYTDYQLNNVPCVGGRLFTKFLAPESDLNQMSPQVTKEECQKIFLGWNFLHYPRMQRFIPLDFSLRKDCNIDVFFAGSVTYGDSDHKSGRLISAHRKKCIEILNSIKDLKVLVIEGRILPVKEYLRIIQKSKIIVSPWGWGEACYRDYEAILSCCILIKPKTDFVESSCGLFQHPFAVWTRPDFSDLDIQIRNALKVFDATTEERRNKRELLIKESLRVKTLIKSVLEF